MDKSNNKMTEENTKMLCREVLSISDTMDVLRSKWTVEILVSIQDGNTRFKDIASSIKRISDKVLMDRLKMMIGDKLIEREEYYCYPPRVEYRLTEHGRQLFTVLRQMTEWGHTHRQLMLDRS